MTTKKGPWLGVMVHHTATKDNLTVEDIRKMHKKRGFGDVGYHYLLQKDKKGKAHLKKGRSVVYNGAHCDAGGYNKTFLGFALIGNFENETPDEEYWEEIIKALCHLIKLYDCPRVLGHREVKATLCPGKNIDLDKIREEVSKKLKITINK